MPPHPRGLFALILAFLIWGLFPVYWKLLREIDSLELLFIRLILTAGACLLYLPLRGSWPDYRAAWRKPRLLGRTLLAALFLSGNWLSFIWAVNTGRVLESSLGYFLCPLVSVLLARFVEKETLGTPRWLAVGLASAGVLIIILEAGRLPVAALVIAFTWSGYALMKKRSGLGPVVGLGLETSLLSAPAALFLLLLARNGSLGLGEIAPMTWGFLALAGFLTSGPLLLFAYAAQRVPLSTIGMGQYIVPSAHFLLALAYGETVTRPVVGGFALIWIALVAYSMGKQEPRRPTGPFPEDGI